MQPTARKNEVVARCITGIIEGIVISAAAGDGVAILLEHVLLDRYIRAGGRFDAVTFASAVAIVMKEVSFDAHRTRVGIEQAAAFRHFHVVHNLNADAAPMEYLHITLSMGSVCMTALAR